MLVQPKLAIGPADDPLEHEADRIADQITLADTPAQAISATPARISRKCSACAAEDEERALHRKPMATSESAGWRGARSVYETLRSPGQPLEASARSYFEPRFGQDFSRVRIHSDGLAHRAAAAVNAKAYTVGSDLVFAGGEYAPHTRQGKQLLAHELTHVVQQSGGRASQSNGLASPAILQRQVGSKREEAPAKTPAKTQDRPYEDCGTGEVEGSVQICCMQHERPHLKECDDRFSDVLFECWDKSPQDAHYLDICGAKARFAECRCLASRLGPQHCKCSGLV